MKDAHVLSLRGWVAKNRSWFLNNRPTLAEAREKATAELGFKCSAGALADCMDEQKIPRRIGKDAAKIQGLTEERDKYRSCLLKIIAIQSVRPDMAEELKGILSFDEEIADVLSRKQAS